MSKSDLISLLKLNKNYGKLCLTQLISDVQKDILENEQKIKTLREKYTNEELIKEVNAFALSRGALKAVDLLNENMYNKIFSDGVIPQDDIILTYRLFFQLLDKNEVVAIKDTNEFWKKTCDYFLTEGAGKTGTMVQNLVKSIDFSNENIYKVSRLLGNNAHKITPAYFSKICGTTGLIIFLIKDALEYAGILQDKKTPSARHYSNALYLFDMLQAKIERLKTIQTKFFS